MKITSPLVGLQVGCVALMMSSAVITLACLEQPISASVEPVWVSRNEQQDEIAAPPDKNAMEKFMARKLLAAQKTLEAIAKDDFESIRKSTDEMIDLSRHEAWERMASARFVQDTADFVSAAEFLRRMADAEDSEGVSLGFTRLTLNCATCHGHVRRAAVAELSMPAATLIVQQPFDRSLSK